MTTARIKSNSIKGLILLGLLLTLSMKSCMVYAQVSREEIDMAIFEKVRAWEDSIAGVDQKTEKPAAPRKNPLYMGLEVTFAVPQHTLKSKIERMNNDHMIYFGGSAGGVLANDRGKLKADGGFYYSEPSMATTVQIMQAATSANIYLLRMKDVKYHTLEPYASIGFLYQLNKFYGTYLIDDPNYNYSQGNNPLMGKTYVSQVTVGGGVEFQLENDQNQFIHVFSEFTYGIPVTVKASRDEFKGTNFSRTLSISVGIGFGIVKN